MSERAVGVGERARQGTWGRGGVCTGRERAYSRSERAYSRSIKVWTYCMDIFMGGHPTKSNGGWHLVQTRWGVCKDEWAR